MTRTLLSLFVLTFASLASSAWAQDESEAAWEKRLAEKHNAALFVRLAESGAKAKPLVPLLVKLLVEAPDDHKRAWLAYVLGRVGVSLEELDPLLASKVARERRAGLLALRYHEPPLEAARAKLIVALSDGSAEVRAAAAMALCRLKPAPASVEALAALLQDTERDVQRAGVFALGRMGSAARALRPEIAKKKSTLRANVELALERIRGPRATRAPAEQSKLVAGAQKAAVDWIGVRREQEQEKVWKVFSKAATRALKLKKKKDREKFVRRLDRRDTQRKNLFGSESESLWVRSGKVARARVSTLWVEVELAFKKGSKSWHERTRWAPRGKGFYLVTVHDYKKLRPLLTGPETQASLEQGAAEGRAWLLRHQHASGLWPGADWHKPCGKCSGDGAGVSDYMDMGVTAIALLAFFEADIDHLGRDPAREPMGRAMNALLTRQKKNGSLGFSTDKSIYNHAYTTWAVAEAYRRTRDPRLVQALERALKFSAECQNTNLGWKYGVKVGRNDSSVTGVMAYGASVARRAGVAVPAGLLKGALNWIGRATDSGGRVGYESPGGGSSVLEATKGKFDPHPSLTALACVLRRSEGEKSSGKSMLGLGLKIVAKELPSTTWRGASFFYWHWGARALVGTKHWRVWKPRLGAVVLGRQVGGGDCQAGSWEPVAEWAYGGGRVYSTAFAAATLELAARP
jgi:hypothetical protein